MSKKWKIAAGIAAIAVGFMLLFAMIGGSIVMRTHAFPSTMSHPVQTESHGETINQWDHGMRGHSGPVSRFGSRGFTPFGFIGGFLRLAAFGVLGLLLFRILFRRSNGEGGVKARVLNEDDIRVGDEINQSTDSEGLTVDDLLQAMKRLGIKKLEL